MYSVFVMMEELIRPILRKELADKIDEGTKKKLLTRYLVMKIYFLNGALWWGQW